ncbi:MAG TPA: hypothetical protein V6D43_21145 [Candidatus Sericytochromatia bacterium]
MLSPENKNEIYLSPIDAIAYIEFLYSPSQTDAHYSISVRRSKSDRHASPAEVRRVRLCPQCLSLEESSLFTKPTEAL